jgi:hypothetical protein
VAAVAPNGTKDRQAVALAAAAVAANAIKGRPAAAAPRA